MAESQDKPDLWSQLDHGLFSLKLRSLERQRRKELENAIQEIHRRNANNLNDATIPNQWLDAQVGHTRALLEDHCRVACEVWATQGKEKTPEFVRSFYAPHVVHFLASRKSGIWEEFHRLFGTVRGRPDSDPVIHGGKLKLERAVQGLQEEWHDRSEVEARDRELEREPGDREAQSKGLPEAPTLSKQTVLPDRRARQRAGDVAKVRDELGTLMHEVFEDNDYAMAKEKHTDFRTFQATEKVEALRQKLCNLQGKRAPMELVFEIVGAIHNKASSTVERDWKAYKPDKVPRKKGFH